MSCGKKGCGEKKLVGLISHPTEKAMALLNADYKIILPQYNAYGERTESQEKSAKKYNQ